MNERTIQARMMAVGDIIIHQAQIEAAYSPEDKTYSFIDCFSEVAKIFESADLVVGNLETTLSGKAFPYTGYPRFNTPEVLAKELKAVGFDLLSTANNHAVDYGETGIISTIDFLSKAGILHIGTARNEREREKPLIVEKCGIKFGFLAYTYGTNENHIPLDKRYLINLIDLAQIKEDLWFTKQAGADLIVCFLHVGTEYLLQPDQEQRKLFAKVEQMGIDIILGSHPHIIQPATFQNNKFSIYSLGNFISNQRGEGKDIGLIVDLIVEKDLQTKSTKVKSVDYHLTYVHKWKEEERLKYKIYLLDNDEGRVGRFLIKDKLEGKYTETLNRLKSPVK